MDSPVTVRPRNSSAVPMHLRTELPSLPRRLERGVDRTGIEPAAAGVQIQLAPLGHACPRMCHRVRGAVYDSPGFEPGLVLYQRTASPRSSIACEHHKIDGNVELNRFERSFLACHASVLPVGRQPLQSWTRRGSNPRSPVCDTGVFPLHYAPRAARRGIEPLSPDRQSGCDPSRITSQERSGRVAARPRELPPEEQLPHVDLEACVRAPPTQDLHDPSFRQGTRASSPARGLG